MNDTPKAQLEHLLGYSLTGNEFTHQNNTRIAMAVNEKIKSAQRELIKEILHDFNDAQMEGKGFDFYFVLRTKLDELVAHSKGLSGKEVEE